MLLSCPLPLSACTLCDHLWKPFRICTLGPSMTSQSSSHPPTPAPSPPMPGIVDVVARLAGSSASFSRDDARLAECVALAGHRTLHARCFGIVASPEVHPLLVEYSSDCTPLRTSKSTSGQTAGVAFKRRDKSVDEYFVQQYCISWIDDAGPI